jgi:hypothetical protein
MLQKLSMPPKKRAPEADIDHSPFVDPEKARGANTPKRLGRDESASSVWKSVKRLKTKNARSQVSLPRSVLVARRFVLTSFL